jgi:hypothetical protein
MTSESLRVTGRTTRQLERMPDGSCFICCNNNVDYVRRLCMRIGGSFNRVEGRWTKPNGDKVLVWGRHMLQPVAAQRIRGIRLTLLDRDHAFEGLSRAEWEGWEVFRNQVY